MEPMLEKNQMFVLNGAIKEWMSMLKATVGEVAPRMTRWEILSEMESIGSGVDKFILKPTEPNERWT